jgi:hypothetical protein
MSENKEDEPILKCPHCEDFIVIEKLNCGIFRHGIFINTGTQINPHEPKDLCDRYIMNNLIYGCGKPFKIIKNGDKFEIQICEYI